METTTILFVVLIVFVIYLSLKSFKRKAEIDKLLIDKEVLQKSVDIQIENKLSALKALSLERKNLESKTLELLALKDQCYMRKGRAFVKYRDYIATEVLDAAVDFKAYYKLTKKNKA